MALTEDKQALNETNGKIEPSKFCVGKVDPSKIKATNLDEFDSAMLHIDDSKLGELLQHPSW